MIKPKNEVEWTLELQNHQIELLEYSQANCDYWTLMSYRCQFCGTVEEKISAAKMNRRAKYCQSCADHENLLRARAIAEERGGKCLATGTFLSGDQKVFWQCSLGHTWETSLYCVEKMGTWCPTCHSSRTEKVVRALFEGAFCVPFNKQRPRFLERLELDGYNEFLQLAFEVNGVQHYRKNARFHSSEKDLQRQMDNDRKKRELCRAEGIALMTIPYFITDEGVDQTRKYIDRKLNEKGFTPVNDIQTVKIDPRDVYDMTKDPTFLEFSAKVKERKGSFETTDYLGISRPLKVSCEEGHSWSPYPYVILNGHWCPECANNTTKTVESIQQELAKEGWSLDLGKEFVYQDAHKKLPMICSGGHPIDRSWNAWHGGKRSCKKCQKEAVAEDFLIRMDARGVEIHLSIPAYDNGDQIAAGTCSECGGVADKQIKQWKLLTSCPQCGRKLEPYHLCMA